MTMTLKQLSHILGLSQTTVSRALNGYPEVNEKTRLRVVEAARLHAYAPDPRARGLATGRAMMVGHVLARSATEMVNPVFGEFLAGAGAVYTARGYSVHVTFVDPQDEAAHFRRLKDQRTVDAVVLHSPREGDPRIALLSTLGLPFALHGKAADIDIPYTHVEMDNAMTATLAVDHLAGLGHRRIAMLNGPEGLSFSRLRRDAFCRAMAAHGLEVGPDAIRHDQMTEGYGADAARVFLAREDPPTAFLCGSVLVAIGVRRAAADAGLTIGRDLSLVAHDDALSYLPNAGHPPPFTATLSSVREAGARLADLLIDRIEDNSLAPAAVMLEPELVVGASSGPAPRSPVVFQSR